VQADFLFNGQHQAAAALQQLVAVLNDPAAIASRGGILWKFLYDPGLSPALEFSAFPSIVDGERTHHYELPMRNDDNRALTGVVSASNGWMILAGVKSKQWDDQMRSFVSSEYRQLADFLYAAGYTGDAVFDEIGKQYASAAGIGDGTIINLRMLRTAC